MINLEKRGLVGEAEVKLYGPEGILKSFRKTKNLTVKIGFRTVCDMMGRETGQPPGFQHCAIGTSSVDPHGTQTALGAELTRVLGGYSRPSDTVWKNDATFGAGTGTGTLHESGLFNGGSPATMLCRQTFGTITKGDEDSLVITWQYTLSSA